MITSAVSAELFSVPILLCLAVAACSTPADGEDASPRAGESPERRSPGDTEQRAVDYLAGEVARWREENGCFSCHNNGDAARALMTAAKQSFEVKDETLAGTLAFLRAPERWDANNKGNPAFSDRDLARLQFAAALFTASELGYVDDAGALRRASRLLGNGQAEDGSWRAGSQAAVGSPVTYGRFLATRLALRTLRGARSSALQGRIEKGAAWLRATRPKTVLDAAAVLLELGGGQDGGQDGAATVQRQRSLELIRRGQGKIGAWGPYVGSPPEVFDTAVVLIALAGLDRAAELKDRMARGRAFLLRTQEPGGGWPETTRPPGAQSYAQHISTSAWALLALLATR